MYIIKITESQRELLQSLLCDASITNRDKAVALVDTDSERALKMLKKYADADALWSVVNTAEEA